MDDSFPVFEEFGNHISIAFTSFYVQFPGLLSSSGLEPVHRLLPFASPFLYRTFILSHVMDEDTLVEIIAIVGMILSTMIVVALPNHPPHGANFLILTVLYELLVRVGGTFYSFQWDTLLIETGLVTALCYAPWTMIVSSTTSTTIMSWFGGDANTTTTTTTAPWSNSKISAWPLRFLLFKLMFMSGLVKLQSECPTWQQLTALEYHFATQCLPNPMSWYFHQLHPFLLRLSVACTLWIELPMTVLLIGFTTPIRRVGVYWQWILQIMIILTGNYNFFNLLTMILCLPCYASDDNIDDIDDNETSNNEASVSSKSNASTCTTAASRRWETLGITIFSIGTFLGMFRIHVVGNDTMDLWHSLNISLNVSNDFCEKMTELLLPWIILAVLSTIIVQGIHQAWTTKSLSLIVHTVVCVVVLGVIAIPMSSLTETTQRNGFIGSKTLFYPLWQKYAMPYRAANGYGLFRRMTGVGRADDAGQGWAGLNPSIVARPEIILEGLFESQEKPPKLQNQSTHNSNTTTTKKIWREIRFRWKPGYSNIMPRQVAPHQPRLDWQMWFAALGGSQQNPWFIHLVKKLLDGCPDVCDLVGDPRLVQKQQLGHGRRRDNPKQMIQLRANLYHYDFTRLDTEWNRRLPNTFIVGLNHTTFSRKYPWLLGFLKRPPKYWKRTFARKYLLPMESNNHPIQEFLTAHGYKSTCRRNIERCRTWPSVWCRLVVRIRKNGWYVFPAMLVLIVALGRPNRRRSRPSRLRAPPPTKRKDQ